MTPDVIMRLAALVAGLMFGGLAVAAALGAPRGDADVAGRLSIILALLAVGLIVTAFSIPAP